MNCKNRIKPKLLREQKTEALLVFIRTTLEQYFYHIEITGYYFKLGTSEDDKVIQETLKTLLNHLRDRVIDSVYLKYLIQNANKNPTSRMKAKKEEPLAIYYNSLVKELESSLPSGSLWIPEVVVLCLLSEWIFEEEKSTYLYPFLQDIDYIELISKYDNIKKELDDKNKEIIMSMYKISSKLIEKLKITKYKINTLRKKRR